ACVPFPAPGGPMSSTLSGNSDLPDMSGVGRGVGLGSGTAALAAPLRAGAFARFFAGFACFFAAGRAGFFARSSLRRPAFAFALFFATTFGFFFFATFALARA